MSSLQTTETGKLLQHLGYVNVANEQRAVTKRTRSFGERCGLNEVE